MPIDFSGTKEQIFEAAIDMFATEGYENVSMREIAKRCSIKASSIYNHFPGKQDILNAIYAYYTEYGGNILLDEASLREIAQHGTREEFVDSLFPSFDRLPEPQYHRLVLITKIIFMRVFNDPQAAHLFQTRHVGMDSYIVPHLHYAIAIGRIRPILVEEYALLINGYRIYMGINAFSDPNYSVHQLEEEARIKRLIAEMIPFVY